MVNPLVVLAAESGPLSGVDPYAVGAGTLILFVLALAVVLVIGGGREHS
jgi:hypothetical protein